MEILEVTPEVMARRQKWSWVGADRPDFAEAAGEGMESVWDYPRPPRVEPVGEPLRVVLEDAVLAKTDRGVRVCETAGAPTYYFPPDALRTEPEPTGARSQCEWKGLAEELLVEGSAPAWRYVAVYPEYRDLYHWVAFYPRVASCYVGDEPVTAQPGGYYGGWVTSNLAGPIKGAAGTEHW